MTFGAPEWFFALLVIPVVVLIFLRAERKSAERLRELVAPRLLPQLIGTVDRRRRRFRLGLQLFGLACAIVALAQPRWGYTFQDVKRKGLDVLIAIDTSKSMLSNDVQPNRLQRVKLATEDLINDLTGDRVGMIAFAGRAFVQAPLTIDYDAVVQSISELDTNTIPEGGTNISEAITLAMHTFGKSAGGNRALVIFTDGEELSGDAVKTAKSAADNGIRIFTLGVGTPQGSLIPVAGEDGGTSFVKDPSGQIVKSKLDEKRLREIAQATGGTYWHLQNGPRTMQELVNEGLTKLNAAEMDVRLARRPIERYHWPLGLGLLALASSMLMTERKRARAHAKVPQPASIGVPAAVASLVLMLCASANAAVNGLQLYDAGKFPDAYRSFEQDLQNHPSSAARDRMEFDAGAAAYKMRDYNKALEAFSGSLLSNDRTLQERSQYNLGRTLEDRADLGKSDEQSLKDLEDAESHYEEALKLDPNDQAAKDNLDEVRKKIERLKNRKPTPTPPPQSSQQKKNKNEQSSGEQNQQQQSSQQNQQNQQNSQQEQQAQSQNQNNTAQNKNSEQQQSQSRDQQAKEKQQLAKNEPQKNQQPQANESPSPSPGQNKDETRPSPGEQQPDQPPTPSEGQEQNASPSPGAGSEQTPEPSASPSATAGKPGGEIKAAGEQQSQQSPQGAAQSAGMDATKDEQMTPQQAEALLQSMKDEEARVQLDERRPRRSVYKDW